MRRYVLKPPPDLSVPPVGTLLGLKAGRDVDAE